MKRWIPIILLLYGILGVTYALTTPVFEASDELWHYPMVRHLADGNPLPVQASRAEDAGPWKQQASQPPLYYYLAAGLTFWIDTADMPTVRHLNPHVDNGVITPDGNINLVVHDPTLNPWAGTLLAVRLIRLFSVALGICAVYLTSLIARELTEREELIVGATAVHAFTPMYLFVTGAVNNDNLVVPLASLALLLMIRAVKTENVNWQQWVGLGCVIGLAALAKISGVGLLFLAWGTTFVVGWKQQFGQQNDTHFWVRVGKVLLGTGRPFALIILPTLAIAGWWYWRNIQLYGDWTGWNAFIVVLGQRAHPADLAQLWSERWGFMLSYWGLFGGVNVPMWTSVYYLLNGVAAFGALGFAFYLGKLIWLEWRNPSANSGYTGLPLLVTRLVGFVVHHFALVLCLLWLTAIIIGLIQWATVTWSSQGRLVFTAMSAINTLLVLGLFGWLSKQWARIGVGIFAGFLFVVSAMAPFVWIQPAYAVTAQERATEPVTEAVFGEQIALLSYDLILPDDNALQPADSLQLRLTWQVLEPITRDWSVFVHLNDPVLGRPMAQRDMYLGQGLLSTRFLEVGDIVTNRYDLTLPPTTIAPAELQLSVGLYDFYAGERLMLADGQTAVSLAMLPLQPKEGDYPNSLSVNFEDTLELVGFEVNPRLAQANDTVNVTLYWQPLRDMEEDYALFLQLVDLETTMRYGAQDLALPTSQWAMGEVQTVSMQISVAEETPSDLFPLIVGAYTQTADGSFQRLRQITPDGRITQDDFLILTPIRIEEE